MSLDRFYPEHYKDLTQDLESWLPCRWPCVCLLLFRVNSVSLFQLRFSVEVAVVVRAIQVSDR